MSVGTLLPPTSEQRNSLKLMAGCEVSQLCAYVCADEHKRAPLVKTLLHTAGSG